ncbi:MAG: sialate O-acetylesterase [Candidatus Pseudobacter hemicellulosilyticus]|uniref:Sialate O-acetylesterase n=1 Tax=Candidatus Pseudobacter hemicellulosilyticus TaxID=3121375 RepID=A0AAJ5WUV4_9BACT|nr:MAG: sialate O-acetylesterase [Pseudobacter sp.]
MRQLFYAIVFFIGTSASAQLKVAAIFGNHMVLQQGINAPVWGWAAPNTKLSIRIAEQTIPAEADATGKWMARLPLLNAGGPYTLEISTGSDRISFSDVLVGEVWLASGQSNMWWPVNLAANPEAEISNANDNSIRLLTVPQQSSTELVNDLGPVQWQPCSPAVIKDFSAVGYAFARNLRQELKVPVGIIHASWGATPAEAWTSGALLRTMPAFRDTLRKLPDAGNWDRFVDNSNQLDAQRQAIMTNAKEGLQQNAHKLSYNDADWGKASYPLNAGTNLEAPGYWGFIWLRKKISVDQSLSGKTIKLVLPYLTAEQVDIYWDGKPVVEKTKAVNGAVEYVLPVKTIAKGGHLLAIRNYSNWGIHKVGVDGVPARITSDAGSKTIVLDGEWRFNRNLEPAVAQWQNWYTTPTVLYNKMIAPIMPYGLKGFIWYQGESNASRAKEYQILFPLMINDWRIGFQQGPLPFLFVQLANFMAKDEQPPARSEWAELREAQTMTLQYPNTGMAVAIDIGDANDIHPKNKQEVGRRLSLAARQVAYGEAVSWRGPVYDSMKIQDAVIRLYFNSSNGLQFSNSSGQQHFAVAGADKQWHWADEVAIEGNCILVRCSKVKNPVAVRYAWGNNPAAGLTDGAAMPASPFRTDDW